MTIDIYVIGFEKTGHFGQDLNFEILIRSESIRNQLSFQCMFHVHSCLDSLFMIIYISYFG